MSVQFGRWNFEGPPPTPEYIEKVSSALAPYGPDSDESYSNGGVTILYRAFHTTEESHRERQPHISSSGAVITWDGRLDNRTELISELRDSLSVKSTDVDIVAASHEKWGAKCLGKLLGDWALSIWNSGERSVLLAKNPIGTRHLYYSFDNDQVTWSTVLDPLVRLAGKTFAFNEEYIAGWFSMFPAADLTPCVGIHSVPSSSFVLLRPGSCIVRKYWDFDPEQKIRYRTDAEYEEHFRTVFASAVQRKLRSDRPVLAELSGGRDSSSIVCMADLVIARGAAETPRLDTLSMYDDSEPNWNERPYFTKVEEKRGRTGWHINVGTQDSDKVPVPEPAFESPHGRFVPTPGYDGRTSPQLRACLTAQGNRVVLSGVGGDEVMGGVPTPVPELANLLARGQFGALAHQLKLWALEKRKPWFHLLWEAAREFFPPALVGVPKNMHPAPWLQSSFVKRHRAALTGYPSRTKLFGPLPSFQDNAGTLDALRRQLACTALPFEPPFEKRYPYLDRDLLEFMFAIPREQLVRPSQRRSLMRRALVGIVPDEILNRKTKAFVVRSPMVAISNDWVHLSEMTQNMLSDSLGIVDSGRIAEALQKVRRGEEVRMITLRRTLYLEGWLNDLHTLGIMNLDTTFNPKLRWQAPPKASPSQANKNSGEQHIEIERGSKEQIMSVQYGRWNFVGQSPAPNYIEKVSAALAPYGPDSNELYSKGGIEILYRAFHTTKESRCEKQPHICSSGAVITWDGRLDNRAELISELSDSLTINSTDVAVVAAAYDKWGANCLQKLIGDWAVSIWDSRGRFVLLAKDPIGTKHLYYLLEDKQLTWSTILDPLVLFAGKTFEICEEYIAGWFSYFPAAHLTPYAGIQSVPMSSSVFIQPGKLAISKYWDFDPEKKIRYRADGEYEEHFRTAFTAAVQRRLRSDRPVLAELSGGMDSSSIVCVADTVIARGAAETPRLDTISWYDDSYDHVEPDWNECTYFKRVEEKRGRIGCHINLGSLRRDGSQTSLASNFESSRFAATPNVSTPCDLRELFEQYSTCMRSHGHRVSLSGIGGDEVTGGSVPTPTPELQNLLARSRFFSLARQLNAWAVKMKKSRLRLLWETARGFLTPVLVGVGAPDDMIPPPWFHPDFIRRNRSALCGYPSRIKLFGALPSFQDNLATLEVLRRTLVHLVFPSNFLREVRFPYLDRDLMEFMYAIPREQIVRLGQRRSLMKRALSGIVPNELLTRRQKAVVLPEPRKHGSIEWLDPVEIDQHVVSSSIGVIDRNRFLEALQKARLNEKAPVRMLERTLTLEFWLRHLLIQGALRNSVPTKRPGHHASLGAMELTTSVQPKSSAS